MAILICWITLLMLILLGREQYKVLIIFILSMLIRILSFISKLARMRNVRDWASIFMMRNSSSIEIKGWNGIEYFMIEILFGNSMSDRRSNRVNSTEAMGNTPTQHFSAPYPSYGTIWELISTFSPHVCEIACNIFEFTSFLNAKMDRNDDFLFQRCGYNSD